MSFLNNQERTVDGINTFNADVIDIVEDIEVAGNPGDAYNVLQKSATNALQWAPLRIPDPLVVGTVVVTNVVTANLNATTSLETPLIVTTRIDASNTNTTNLTATNIAAHAQTGNITMSGLHNIGTDSARSGSIFSTTIDTTYINGGALTGVLIPSVNNTQALGDPSYYFANTYATTTNTTNLSAHAQTGNITMSGTHHIGTADKRTGTIYSTSLDVRAVGIHQD